MATKSPIFNQLNIIFLSMLAGQVLLLGIIHFVVGVSPDQDDSMIIIIPVILASAMVGAYMIYQNRKGQAAELETLEEKVAHYRSSAMLRLALMEGAVLLSIIAYFLEGNTMYLSYIAVGIMTFGYYRPSEAEFEKDYE